MGIKHVWTILTPFGNRKPLYELQGKRIAIDLSGWVCESQNITEYYIQPKMYLRNLYFRACYLLLMEVGLVFVLEGKAPDLKYATIASRNEIQFKGSKPKASGTSKVGKDRSRFNHVLKCCREMLSYLGLACVVGNGEAEALCAYLDKNGMVNGCVSQDSDCFAYGARTVYKNFSISQQGAHAGIGGAVDVYDIGDAIKAINFGRNKVVALSVLCGCDYSDGVYGIGKEAAMKLFENVEDDNILDHLRSWKTNTHLYDSYHKMLTDKNKCTSCGHPGKIATHNKSGCSQCYTNQGCDSSIYKEKRANVKNEVAMRSKAIADSTFPDEKLIDEFLVCKENVSKLDLKWKQPDLISFIKFVKKHLQWDEIYAFEKFFPILTRWQILNYLNQDGNLSISPKSIKKVRKHKGVACYEIVWVDSLGHYKDIFPKNLSTESVDLEQLWSTIEPQELVKKAYPDIVESFELSKIKPKKSAKRKNKNNPADQQAPSKPKRKNKTEVTGCQPITAYFTAEEKPEIDELDMSSFGDENDLDISNIVEEIVNRAAPKYVRDSVNKIKSSSKNVRKDPEMSSFFVTNWEENDLFEKSMVYEVSSDSSDDDLDEDEDSFVSKYVPLMEKIKGKI